MKASELGGPWNTQEGDEKCVSNLLEKPESKSQLGHSSIDGNKTLKWILDKYGLGLEIYSTQCEF
jgi:hypothetical protein